MEISEHFGVYGVCIKEGKLLCVQKHGGPYNGRYDLPGGGRKKDESLLDTLCREMMEETSYRVKKVYDNSLFDTFVRIGEQQFVHHIFGLYNVELAKAKKSKMVEKYINEDEVNDSLGEEWVELKKLNESNSSPLILQVLKESKEFQAKRYDQWDIYDD